MKFRTRQTLILAMALLVPPTWTPLCAQTTDVRGVVDAAMAPLA